MNQVWTNARYYSIQPGFFGVEIRFEKNEITFS